VVACWAANLFILLATTGKTALLPSQEVVSHNHESAYNPLMDFRIRHLRGANMDIDLASAGQAIPWAQDACPWNADEGVRTHRCAIKNTSICPYFCGVEYLDTLLCCYPYPNPRSFDGYSTTDR
jgi:hypothetical protein